MNINRDQTDGAGDMKARVAAILDAHILWAGSGGRRGFPAVFQDMDLTGMSFSGCILDNVSFRNCTLGGADFSGTSLKHAIFIDCTMDGASFKGTSAPGLVMVNVKADGMVIEEADMSKSTWIRSSITGGKVKDSYFDRSYVLEVSLEGVRASGVKMRDADLYSIVLGETQMEQSTLKGSRVFVSKKSGKAVLNNVETSGLMMLNLRIRK